MVRGQVFTAAEDPYAGQPTDSFGIPECVAHKPQTDLPIWQYVHKLESPYPNPKNAVRPYTHICVVCASLGVDTTWQNALMRQRMSTNAVAHVQRVHPEEFVAVADYKQRKRVALVEKAAARASEDGQPKKKRAKRTPKVKTKPVEQLEEKKEREPPTDVLTVAPVARKTPSTVPAARKQNALVKNWLMSTGLPVSVLQDETHQQLLKLSTSAVVNLPTTADLNAQVQVEFAQFRSLLRSYLAAESAAAMNLPFLSLCHEFRPITEGGESTGRTSSQQSAFFSVAIDFIDSRWQKMDLVLAAKEVPRGWGQQVDTLVAQTISETYDIGIPNYARFRVATEADSPSALALGGNNESTGGDQEDLLTRTLRSCVVDALGIGNANSFSGETNVRRILRLLQELAKYFEAPDRSNALATISSSHGVAVPFRSASSIEELAVSTSTSIGAVAELLRDSCTRYPAYWLYFQASARPTVSEPELESAWMQLSDDDWSTAAEIEAIINQLGQFRLEERITPRPGAVAPSYSLLFRRLLSVTTNAHNLKCLSLEDDYTTGSSSVKRIARRKPKLVDSFTPTGRQCIAKIRQLTAQRFASPSTPTDVDSEVKAMLLDPRISSKAGEVVTDKRAFRRAHDDLREEHRVIFKLLANQQADGTSNSEDDGGDVDNDDDDEMSALLMVEGPKKQPPTAPSTTGNGRRSSDAVADDEARAWREWQQVYIAWDTIATEGADLFDKGQYNLLKLYHHVNILKWFQDVGQQAHPAASLLARMYLGQQSPPSRVLGSSYLRFTEQEEAGWTTGAVQRAEQRCILHHNWRQYQQLSANAAQSPARNDNISTI